MKLKLLKFIAFLLPFELLASYVAHALFKPAIGEFYRLLFNGAWGLIVSLLILSYTKIQKKYLAFFLICLLFIFAGFWEFLVTFFLGGMSLEASSQFICGFFFPSILFITLINSSEEIQGSFFKSWYLGTTVLLILSYLATIYYYQNLPDWYKEKDASFKLIAFRYAFDTENVYSNGMMLLLGNFNKASNTLLMMLLFSIKLLGNNSKNRRFIIFFWIVSVITLFVLFSRLVLLILPIVYFVSGFHKFLKGSIDRGKLFTIIGFFFLGTILKFSYLIKPSLDYLLTSKFDDNSTDIGLLGTGNNRLRAWSLLIERLNNMELWLHGMGVGAYGIEHADSKDAGTHNLLFDHFLASGIFVPILIISFLFICLLKGFIRKDNVVIFGVLIITSLFFREYSFSYLFVTSHGGIIFILLLFTAHKYFNNKVEYEYFV